MGQARQQPMPDTADRSWMVWTLVGMVAIWIGVVAISITAPDLVSGSQQEHLPLAAFVAWIWGLIATVGFLWGMSKLRGSSERKSLWTGFAVAVVIVWSVAIVLSAAMPVWEMGSDPTRLPLWALVVPLGAALLTALAAVVVGLFSESPSRR
jgi:hypothetical protein